MNPILQAAVEVRVDLLVRGEYEALARLDGTGRQTPEHLRQIVEAFGRTLIEPPVDAWRDLDSIRVGTTSPPTFHVLVRLWTAEEGESVLTLELMLVERENKTYRSDLLDLYVLDT